MKIFRSVLSGLAAFICLSSIIGLIYLFTLQATIMDRSVVKGWLNDSKIYEGNLIASLIQPTEEPGYQAESTIDPTPAMVKTALTATFTPEYIRQQTEVVIDSAYDWTEGAKADFTFSIPIDQKRDTFIQQLAKALEPQIVALPICGAIQTTTCRPANLNVEQLALQTATQGINDSGAFTAPITPDTFSQAPQQPNTLSPSQLPALRQGADQLFIILPIVIILSALATVFVVQSDRRMRTSIKLSRRIFFSTILTTTAAFLVVFILHNNYFDLSQMFAARIADLVTPLIKIIIIDIAINLALFGGIAGAIALTTWIALRFMQQKNNRTQLPNFPTTSTRY